MAGGDGAPLPLGSRGQEQFRQHRRKAMLRWVIAGELARDCRPGYAKECPLPLAKEEIEEWIKAAKRYRIQSLLCLHSQAQLTHYAHPQTDLLAYYRQQGLQVLHIPLHEHHKPLFSEEQLEHVWEAYRRLPKPVLVHGAASRSSTIKQAVAYILQCRERFQGKIQPDADHAKI